MGVAGELRAARPRGRRRWSRATRSHPHDDQQLGPQLRAVGLCPQRQGPLEVGDRLLDGTDLLGVGGRRARVRQCPRAVAGRDRLAGQLGRRQLDHPLGRQRLSRREDAGVSPLALGGQALLRERLVHQGVAEGQALAGDVPRRLDNHPGRDQPGHDLQHFLRRGARGARQQAHVEALADGSRPGDQLALPQRKAAPPGRGSSRQASRAARLRRSPAACRSLGRASPNPRPPAPAPRGRRGCRRPGAAARPAPRRPAPAPGPRPAWRRPPRERAARGRAPRPGASRRSSARIAARASLPASSSGRKVSSRATGRPRSARAMKGTSDRLVASAQCRSSSATRSPREPASARM